MDFDLQAYLERQIDWSRRTFGPGARTLGISRHIQTELIEIQKMPQDIREWIDVAILAFDGAWRAGWTPEEIVHVLAAKQLENFARKWPPPGPQDQPTEHIRDGEIVNQKSEIKNDPGH